MRLRAAFPYEVTVRDHEWATLSDGTRLCARVWLPTSALRAPVPAVLEYLPYRKNDGTAWQDSTRHAYFAGHGYASIRIDIRGTGDSDGIITDEYSDAELADGLEVLRWIAAQPWCSGRVGMIGYSWGGINGLQLAALRPPELAAVITLYSTDDRFADDCHYKGGIVLGSDMLPWASTMLAYDARPPDPRVVGERWREMWLERLAKTPAFSEAWLSHQTFDDYWRRGSVCTDYAAIEVPILAVGGLADPYTNTVARLLEHLPGFRRGIIGPWGHVFPERGVPGPAIGFLQECVRWWDQWLADKDRGVAADPLLRVWMPEWSPPARTVAEKPGRWLAIDTWPSRAESETFSFHAAGERLPADVACGQRAGAWCPNGLDGELPDDQADDDARSLVFDSAPLTERLELLGRPDVRLRIRSDRERATIVARLTDVAPDGSSLLVTWQQVRVDAPDDMTEVSIRLDMAAHAFAPGHRVRLALSGAYWPHAWPDPVTPAVDVFGAVLDLPRAPDGARDLDAPFGQPESAAPLHRADHETAHRHVASLEYGIAAVEAWTRAREQFEDGTGHAFERTDRYTVRDGDPLSARVECDRTAEVFSEGWRTRVVTHSVMTCDDAAFVLENVVEAFEGNEQVWNSRRLVRVPRADL